MTTVPRAEHLYLLRCPVCATAMERVQHVLRCSNGHAFDLAREGYVNLLRKKLSGDVGDTREMLLARRAFLDRGYYQPLARQVSELVARHIRDVQPVRERPLTILDAGCGEGYYLHTLQTFLDAQHTGTVCLGIDVSKEAVRLAARSYRESFFVVANVREPLVCADGAFSVLLNIFAPRNPPEFARVLAPGGLLLVLLPGPAHLQELRTRFSLLAIEENKQQHVQEQFAVGFELLTTRTITYGLSLLSEDVIRLVTMTPNHRHLSDEQRQAMGEVTILGTTVEAVALLFLRKRY